MIQYFFFANLKLFFVIEHVRLLEHKPEFCIDFSKLRNLMILNIDREAKLIFKNRHYSQLKFLNIPSILGDVEQFEEGNSFQVSEAIGLYSDCTYIGKLLENLYHKRSKLKKIIIWCFCNILKLFPLCYP
jgi:hypothetical protein